MATCPQCEQRYSEDTTTCPDDGEALIPGNDDDARGALAQGSMVGEYRVDYLLGSGTFGDVYAGEQPLIGKRVAIKLLARRFSSEPQMISRFIAEARAVNRIRHRNIIDIFSFGTLPGRRHYFVMELLSGEILSQMLEREGTMKPAQAAPILRGVAEALFAAHRAGVAHRDLKPDNVFIAHEEGGQPFPKLLDFGVAKLLGEPTATHKTATGAPIGTPSYMSPEQCRGAEMDHRTDIYAFGVLTHRVLTGSLPFNAKVTMDLMVQHTSQEPPPMSSVSADVPPGLDAPVLAMLAKDPAARPPTMADAWNALQAAMEAAGLIPKSVGISASPALAALQGYAAALTSSDEKSDKTGDTQRANADARSAEATPVSTPAEGAASATLTAVNSSRPAPSSPPARSARSRLQIIAGLSALGAIAIGAAMAVAAGKPSAPGASSPASVVGAPQAPRAGSEAAASPASSELALGPTVKLRVLSTLPDASVWINDTQRGKPGEAIILPRGKDTITIELRRAGYRPKRVAIVPDDDMTIPLDLEAAPPAATAARAPQPPSYAAPPGPAAASPAKAAAAAASPSSEQGGAASSPPRPAAGTAPKLGEVDTPDEFQ